MADTPSVPENLGPEGRALWDAIRPNYELRPDEERMLSDACREADMLAKLEAAQRKAPLMSSGSMGQKIISPYISEMRQHRTVLSALLKALKLPDEANSGSKADYTSEHMRKAARARWDKARKGA